jgi:hypothetical protein
MSRTLAELNVARREVEALITETVISKAITDAQHAERDEKLAELHTRLSILLAETEMAAWRDAPELAGTLRWACYGADHMADWHRIHARKWRALDGQGAAVEVAVRVETLADAATAIARAADREWRKP